MQQALAYEAMKTAPEIIDFPGAHTVVVRGKDILKDDLPKFIDRGFKAIGVAIRRGQAQISGVGFTRFDTPFDDAVTLEIGFPVEEPVAETTIDGITITPSTLPKGKTMVTRHYGSYDGLHQAWLSFREELAERGYDPDALSWEAYDVGPLAGRPPSDYVTGLAIQLVNPDAD